MKNDLGISRKVLVTGATGLLGANVCKQLIEATYSVKVIIRKGCDSKGIDDLACEHFYGNLSDKTDLQKAVEGCDYIIHCAADTSQNKRLDEYNKINVEVVANLIDLSIDMGIKRFIHVSTTNCFTNGSKESPGDENGGFMPWLKDSGYAYSKYMAQQLITDAIEKRRFPAIIVAPSFIIGPRDAKVSSGKLVMLGYKNRVVFYPPGGKSFVDAEYAANAIVNALEMGQIGEKYILAGENLTLKEFLIRVKQLSGQKGLFIPLPQWFLSTVATILDVFKKVLGLRISLTRVNQRLLCLDNYFSAGKAERELKLQRTDLNKSIKKAIKWYEENA